MIDIDVTFNVVKTAEKVSGLPVASSIPALTKPFNIYPIIIIFNAPEHLV